MCEPVTIGLLAGAGTAGAGAAGALGTLTAVQTATLALSAGSTAVGARAAYTQTKSAKQTANYNAQVAEVQAQDARTRGDEEASRVRRQNAQLAGAQRAGFAAKGIDFSDGSAADALDQTDFFSQIDQNTARDNANIAASQSASGPQATCSGSRRRACFASSTPPPRWPFSTSCESAWPNPAAPRMSCSLSAAI